MTEPEVPSRRLRAFAHAAGRAGPAGVSRSWQRLLREGFPIIESARGERGSSLVTFVWRPDRSVTAPSLYTPVAEAIEGMAELLPLGVGGVWYRSLTLSNRTRAMYGFSPISSLRPGSGLKTFLRYIRTVGPDPLNSEQIFFPKDPDDPSDRAGTRSVVQLPKAPPQPWTRAHGPWRGTEEHRHLPSRNLRGRHSVWVFLPPRFNSRGAPYNLLIAFDGIAYRDTVPAPTIVQNLVDAGRISPTVVVLVGNAPGARTQELNRNPAFARYLARVLLPWLRRRYGLRTTASRTVLAGSSLGAVAAVDTALRYPKLFGNVLAQSGAFQWFGRELGGPPTSLMQEYVRAPKLPLRFYLDAGTQEAKVTGKMPLSLLGSVRHLRDVLEAKGYPVAYAEFDGGHDYACWRGTLADGILLLLGRPRRRRP
ncbi:MAG: alpha/beta hydrolase-fold protein [Thermoplasmata archaeon]